jgi:hypothetical protein
MVQSLYGSRLKIIIIYIIGITVTISKRKIYKHIFIVHVHSRYVKPCAYTCIQVTEKIQSRQNILVATTYILMTPHSVKQIVIATTSSKQCTFDK